jgi:hypothetical protein
VLARRVGFKLYAKRFSEIRVWSFSFFFGRLHGRAEKEIKDALLQLTTKYVLLGTCN